MFVAALVTASFCGYKTYNAYQKSNMSEVDLLVLENLSALSDPGTSSFASDKPKTKKIKVVKDSGTCYKIEYFDIEQIEDPYDPYWNGIRYCVKCTPEGHWTTCKKIETEDLEAEDQCEKQNCADGLSKEPVREGMHYSWLE